MFKNGRNILAIVSSEVVGGHEMQFVEVIATLAELEFRMTVLCSNDRTAEFFRERGFNVITEDFRVEGKVWAQWAGAQEVSKRLGTYFRSSDAVIVSGGTVEACISAARASKLAAREKRVVAYIPMYIDRAVSHGAVGLVYNQLLSLMAGSVDAVLTINRIQARLLGRALRRPVSHVGNVIREVARPLYSKGRRLIYVGRFDDRQKGLVELVKFADFPGNPYADLVLIGDGPDRTAIEAAAAQTQHVRVAMPGWLSNRQIDDFLGLDDCLVMNSRWEGEPLVVREFQKRGLPCIARNITGMRGVTKRPMRFNTQAEFIEVVNRTAQADAASVQAGSPLQSLAQRRDILKRLFCPTE